MAEHAAAKRASAPQPAERLGSRTGSRLLRLTARAAWLVFARLWGVALLLLLWQSWIIVSDVQPIVMPSPAAVFTHLFTNPGVYLPHLLSTLRVAAIGVALGMATGLLFSIGSWYSPFLRGLATPPALVAQSVPVVAMIPVIARVVGYTDWAVITVAGIIVFFPTFVFVSSGLRQTPPGSEDLFDVHRAGRMSRLRHLALPAAVPGLMLALRVSVATTILGALVAEWLIGTRGLGVLLAITNAELRVETVWGVAVLGTAVAVTVFLLATRLERAARERWA